MHDYNGPWPPMKICSIILAAGLSSRMGKFKPLLEIDGVPAVKRLIDSNFDAGVDDIIVVTGHNHEELESYLQKTFKKAPENKSEASSLEERLPKVEIAYNKDYELGMFTSILAGIKAALSIDDYDAFMLFPVDSPLIPSGMMGVFLSMGLDDEDDIWKENFLVPTYEGKKGHPLFIPRKFIGEILEHDGTNGLKGVTSRHEDELIRLETEEEAVVLDMDHPEDYEEIKAYFDKSKSPKLKQNILEETGFEGRLLLVRHGSTRLHKEKIFMGQVDVPLSEDGIEEAKKCARVLVEMDPKTQIIYSSLLCRAEETASIIAGAFKEAGKPKDVILLSDFEEMSLGDWDGRYIEDIKKEFPEEYIKRGENMLTYKRYPDGENYYDLKYRVLKELKRIMKNTDPDGDILIVSHKGVINAIRENLLGLDPLDSWNYRPDRGSVTIIDIKSIK